MAKSEKLNLKKMPNMTLRQRIYEELRTRIIAGHILPGQMITLNGLAKEFGVSSVPVREALWQLESQKIIVIENNKGMYVNKLTKKEMEEALGLRLMLELAAAEKACDKITRKTLSSMESTLKKLDNALGESGDNHDKYMLLNRRYHSLIYVDIDSPMLVDIINQIWARISPYIQILLSRYYDFTTSVEAHYGILDALTKKDKALLVKWLDLDLNHVTKFILEHFDEALPQNSKSK